MHCCKNALYVAKIPSDFARIPYYGKNVLNMLQKCCNLTMHIIIIVIIIIIANITTTNIIIIIRK